MHSLWGIYLSFILMFSFKHGMLVSLWSAPTCMCVCSTFQNDRLNNISLLWVWLKKKKRYFPFVLPYSLLPFSSLFSAMGSWKIECTYNLPWYVALIWVWMNKSTGRSGGGKMGERTDYPGCVPQPKVILLLNIPPFILIWVVCFLLPPWVM